MLKKTNKKDNLKVNQSKVFKLTLVSCFLLVFSPLFAQTFSDYDYDSNFNLDFDDSIESLSDFSYYEDFLSSFNRAKTLVILEPVRVHEMNPHITQYSNDSFVLSSLYEGLFCYNPITLQPDYALAENYKLSRDKKRCQITLRKNAKFSNGENITSSSVRNSFIKLLSTPSAPYSSLLDIIEGAQEFRTGKGSAADVGIYCLDDYTVSIHMKSPSNYLPSVLCHTSFCIVSEEEGVYSGPYELIDVSENCYFLKKNQNYWDASNTVMDDVIFYQSDDSAENAYMLNIGFADWCTGDVDLNLTINQTLSQVNAEFATQFLFFRDSSKKAVKQKSKSVWDYKEFRNAVFEAFPWETLRVNRYVAAQTLVYPLVGYPTVEGFSYTDEIEASKLMESARKKYNIPKEQVLPLYIEVPKNTFSEENKEALKLALEPLGIEITITEINSYNYIAHMRSSNADIFSYTWIGDFADPLAFLELFRSNSSLNDFGYSNEEFDSLLEKAAYVDSQTRYEILAQAENVLLDDYYVFPISHPVSFNVIDLNSLGGWVNNAFDYHPIKYIFKKENTERKPNLVRF